MKIKGTTQEMLTGKAKEAFERWVLNIPLEIRFRPLIKIHNQRDIFISYEDICGVHLSALIIDWLDSVGIYIETCVYPCEKDGNIYFSGSFFGRLGGWDSGNFFDYRHQATQEAIKKAVEIYNKGAT